MFLFPPLRPFAPRLPLFTARSTRRSAPSSHTFSTLPKPWQRISTLNPALIQSEDYLDLSGCNRTHFGFTHTPPGSSPHIHYFRYPSTFPDKCAGFLYYHYHRESSAAPLEGGIRFWQTRSNQPSSFSGGHDLLLPSGAPWEILLSQTTRAAYRRFGYQLLREKLVTSARLALGHRIFAPMGRIHAPLIVFRLTQKFPVNFGVRLRLIVVGPKALHPAVWQFGRREIQFPFTDKFVKSESPPPTASFSQDQLLLGSSPQRRMVVGSSTCALSRL
ncbi:hypothetical protein B0H16DRAFT_1425361 [Mycena metata]|uniref:Uncharacterized protein n=1 Tax=Mycena metata TaxID=1033252 RepID=A0AAD7I8E2_9AGAR|nr:hypothetical protein B0H16DRAFT_1425361 [Mycena metata]